MLSTIFMVRSGLLVFFEQRDLGSFKSSIQNSECAEKKNAGYILQFKRSDHEGRHIHIYRDGKELGVYDRMDGPVRGLEAHFGKDLRMAVAEFIKELNERHL
jgi:hypothetical protein